MIAFHKNVLKQRLKDESKQVVQTVEQPANEYFDAELAKARAFLNSIGITDVKATIKNIKNF